MKQMTPAAVERAMKLQDVMLRAMAKRISWYQAAEILWISGRQMLRWQTRFKHEGYEGLFDRRRGTRSPKRVPLETVETVLRLYQEEYFDFNVRHFHEKLGSEHGIKLSYTWVKAALQGAGLVKARKHRGKHRKRRPRRGLPGMLLHIDGSQHRWFCDDRWYDLLVIMDDATSEVYYPQLVIEESTPWSRPIVFSVSNMSETLTSALVNRPAKRAAPLCRSGARISTWSSRCNTSV